MAKPIDLTGKRFGRLIVIQRMNNDKCGNLCWLCRCECEQEKIIRGNSLKSGSTQSCGCLSSEKSSIRCKKRNFQHGYSIRNKKSKIYSIWKSMNQRCTDHNCQKYPIYGGRGIKVCRRWRNSFLDFLEDMGEPPGRGYSIDRIDNNQGYYKENCRWATRKEQQRNTRKNLYIKYNGKRQLLIELSEKFGIPYFILYKRIYKYGWSPERALTTSVRNVKRKNAR